MKPSTSKSNLRVPGQSNLPSPIDPIARPVSNSMVSVLLLWVPRIPSESDQESVGPFRVLFQEYPVQLRFQSDLSVVSFTSVSIRFRSRACILARRVLSGDAYYVLAQALSSQLPRRTFFTRASSCRSCVLFVSTRSEVDQCRRGGKGQLAIASLLVPGKQSSRNCDNLSKLGHFALVPVLNPAMVSVVLFGTPFPSLGLLFFLRLLRQVFELGRFFMHLVGFFSRWQGGNCLSPRGRDPLASVQVSYRRL